MKKICFAVIAFVVFSSHVMYLKMDSYFLEPNTATQIKLFNGTFDKSENVIDRDRMLDVSLMGNGQRIRVDDSQWTEKDSVTLLNFETGDPGTWVAGVSTAPRSIEMDAEAFNTYLEHEGILDMISWRQENDAMENAAVEKYSKHVKTIFQVGDKRSDAWKTPLGYPIEFVPLENPYELNTGDSFRFKLLRNGQPLKNQLVYAHYKSTVDKHSHDGAAESGHTHENTANDGHEHPHTDEANQDKGHSHDDDSKKGHTHNDATQEHSHDEAKKEHSHEASADGHSHDENTEKEHSHDGAAEHTHTSGQELRTDANGVATAKLTADGIWYLQTIHLVNTEEEGFTHESNWTTLTFEVTHAHGDDTHTHEHEDEEGIPSWAYWVGSLVLVGLLFFWFNRKK